ncbi:MAG: hypothetical protein JNK82_05415 [Myxococcaceae bacterium]|nr:hypothetical protein [Myxococcaceae bacterium]
MTAAGDLYSWGTNTAGALGVGHEFPVRGPSTGLTFGSNVAFMASGGGHACSVHDGGTVRCVGAGYLGQLGNGQRQTSFSAVDVVGLPGAVDQLVLTQDSSCALVGDAVYCWGSHATVSDAGFTLESTLPLLQPELSSGVTQLTAGRHQRCALKAGEVWCWGGNEDGEVGDGLPPYIRKTPFRVPGIDAGVDAVVAGYLHTCALANGDLWCWGSNRARQIWWGTTALLLLQPLKVQGAGNDIVAVAAANRATCVLKGPEGARSVQCWGSGAVGDGLTTQNRTQPATVIGVHGNVTKLVASSDHFCALVDGELRCWGYLVGLGLGIEATPIPITAP